MIDAAPLRARRAALSLRKMRRFPDVPGAPRAA